MKWRLLTFLILYTLTLSGLYSQQATVDSLFTDFYQNDSLPLWEAFELISDSLEADERWEETQVFSDSIYRLGVSLDDTLLTYAALYPLSRTYVNLNDSLKGDSLFREANRLKAMHGYQLDGEYSAEDGILTWESIRYSLSIFADSTHSLSVDEAYQALKEGKFYPQFPGPGLTDSLTYWVAMRVRGFEDKDERTLFSIGIEEYSWDSVYIFFPRIQEDSSYEYKTLLTGIRVREKDKTAVKDWRNFFYLNVRKGETRTVLLKVLASENDQPSPMRLASHPPDFLEGRDARYSLGIKIFAGILIVQLLYFLLLFISTRERSYLPYLLFIFGVFFFVATDIWYADVFPFHLRHYWFFYILGFVIAGIGLLAFALRYLNVKELLPKSYKVTKVFMYIFVAPPITLLLILPLNFLPYETLASFSETLIDILNKVANSLIFAILVLTFIGFIFTIVLGVQALKKGYKPAKPFLLGMIILIIFVGTNAVLVLIGNVTDIELSSVSHETLAFSSAFGIVLQMIVFALGVGLKINLLQEENEKAMEEKLIAQQDQLKVQEEANEKLLQADKMKDEFLANTSHELRTPLNGILGLSEAVHDGVTGPIQAETRENMQMIIGSARRLGSLVNDLLDFSKLKNFDIRLQQKPLDIRSLSQVVMKVSESLIVEKKLDLQMDIRPGLPAVYADENRLQQILYNLIGNAIKFTDEGVVRLSAKQENDRVIVSVEDTGIGISKDKQEGIFRSFEQGDGSSERKYGGTGLGLSITRQLVELHGGHISVDSEVGRGSVFSFDLPISAEDAQELHVAEVSVPSIKGAPLSLVKTATALAEEELAEQVEAHTRAVYRILVVDDEAINRMVLKNHLASEAYEVVMAEDGLQALDILKSGKQIDLVLLDVMMPKMSGFEVCEQLRENYLASELPIIMITAKNQVADLVTGLSSGANDYIVKPFSKQELLARIKTHIDLLTINAATSRFVPFEFLRSLGKTNITEVQLGDQVSRTGAVLFSDIRGYTSLAEDMSPEQTFAFLNAYLGRMGPVIQRHGGFVNQFYGDGIMALFLDKADRALKAAISMIQTLQMYNDERQDKDRQPLRIGIGLHIGSLMMGMIGDDKRLDTGLVADTVNTSSRIEGLTKQFGVDILISGAIYDQLENPEDFQLRYLGEVQAKGKEEIIRLYECFDGGANEQMRLKKESLNLFQQGIKYYQEGNFSQAEVAFSEVCKLNPGDRSARMFMEKSSHQLSQIN
ncbi:MAG: response regulator [Bacteroidota bacterium]